MTQAYIDVRLNLTFEEETYEDIDGKTITERYIDEIEPEVSAIHGLEPGELLGIGESLQQRDSLQIMLANDIPTSIYEYGEEHAD